MASRFRNGSPQREQKQPEPQNGEERQKPVWERSVWSGSGFAKVQVFDGMVQTRAGERREFYVKVAHVEKDEDGKWKFRFELPTESLLAFGFLLEDAFSFIANENDKR